MLQNKILFHRTTIIERKKYPQCRQLEEWRWNNRCRGATATTHHTMTTKEFMFRLTTKTTLLFLFHSMMRRDTRLRVVARRLQRVVLGVLVSSGSQRAEPAQILEELGRHEAPRRRHDPVLEHGGVETQKLGRVLEDAGEPVVEGAAAIAVHQLDLGEGLLDHVHHVHVVRVEGTGAPALLPIAVKDRGGSRHGGRQHAPEGQHLVQQLLLVLLLLLLLVVEGLLQQAFIVHPAVSGANANASSTAAAADQFPQQSRR